MSFRVAHGKPDAVILFVAWLLWVSVTACDGPSSFHSSTREIEELDLFELSADAWVQAPTRAILPGNSEDRPHLISGWHPKTYPVGDEMAAWTLGGGAEATFFVARLQAMEIEIHCAPVVPEGATSPELTVEVNGHVVFQQQLALGWRSYRFEVASDLLLEGSNSLVFRHPPDESDWQPKKDTRVAWRRIEFSVDGETGSSGPKQIAEGKTLFLPVGHRMDFFLDLPSGSRWRAGRVVPRGAAQGLEITWLPTFGQQEEAARSQLFERVEDAVWQVLPGGRSRVSGRLSMQAKGASGGVFVASPRIQLPQGGDPSSTATDELAASAQVVTAGNVGPVASGRPAVLQGGERSGSRTGLPNVIFYVIDTLRSDHLGCYGYTRNTSPRMDAFAEQAVLFENARAQAPWTRASIGSVLTGLWPSVHGAQDDPDALPDAVDTLAERLSGAGYITTAVTANGNIAEPFGFAQGFDSFRYLDPYENDGKIYRAVEVNEHFFAWLDAKPADDDRPMFAYLHTMNPHAPYEAPEPFHSSMTDHPQDPDYGSIDHLVNLALQRDRPPADAPSRLIELYDAEILANDAAFGQLLDALHERGILDDSWLVVLSDHGEEFFEHGGWQHGHSLYVEQLAIPLLIRPPGGTPTAIRRSEMVEHVDILPTMMDLLGLEPPKLTQGTSLVPLLGPGGQAEGWDHRAVAHLQLRGITESRAIDSTGQWKVLVRTWDGTDGFPQLFDRLEDPAELKGQSFAQWPLSRHLADELRRLERETPHPFTPEVADDVPQSLKEQLHALGYLR